jgi:hypothetical protein
MICAGGHKHGYPKWNVKPPPPKPAKGLCCSGSNVTATRAKTAASATADANLLRRLIQVLAVVEARFLLGVHQHLRHV